MGQRLDLQTLLENLMGTRSVYFQAPNNLQMQYPAVIYDRDFDSQLHADNLPYRRMMRYELTHIGRNPDDPSIEKLRALPLCSFQRHFVNDGLHHDVFNIYF